MRLRVHFIGIGGVSMSCMAKYMSGMGFDVDGSDVRRSEYVDELVAMGINVAIGHSEENIAGAHVAVYSDAIKEDNVELAYARREKLYVISRAELLKSIAENFALVIGVAGCHGKTTVTCMLSHIFAAAHSEFTAHIGGEDLEFSNCVLRGHYAFISEVCEYKKNMLSFPADIAVCLNADKDHMDCYADYDELKNSYREYLKSADKAVVCADDPALGSYKYKNAVTFGVSKPAKYGAADIKDDAGKYSFAFTENGKKVARISLRVVGRHNVINALAAAACARESGISAKYIARGLRDFRGVKRRFEKIGEINGAETIIDYAHHPREITAALAAAKEKSADKTIVVFQPHTYSRTIFLKDEFVSVLSGIENLLIYKTFPAREGYIEGGDAADLCKALGRTGAYFDDFSVLYSYLEKNLSKGDLLLVLGAGDLAERFREELR